MTILGAILAYFFLEGTWRVVVIVALLLSDVVEIAIWLRWRKRRAITGADAMVGMPGTVLTDLAPEGQVKVQGQIWKAVADEELERGQSIEVTEVEGLRLRVARR
ncbi:MAG: NfeD family protein [Actinomycetota bacterium]